MPIQAPGGHADLATPPRPRTRGHATPRYGARRPVGAGRRATISSRRCSTRVCRVARHVAEIVLALLTVRWRISRRAMAFPRRRSAFPDEAPAAFFTSARARATSRAIILRRLALGESPPQIPG